MPCTELVRICMNCRRRFPRSKTNCPFCNSDLTPLTVCGGVLRRNKGKRYKKYKSLERDSNGKKKKVENKKKVLICTKCNAVYYV